MKYAVISLLLLALAGCSKSNQLSSSPHTRPTRVSVIEDLKSWPADIRAQTEKESPSFKQWADAQLSGVCYLHHAKMQRKWVPVVYGLPDIRSLPTKEVADTEFPLADDGYFPGGCVQDSVKEMEIYVCDQCTAALLAWKKKHPKKEANQAPEPTPTTVTPPAGQEARQP